MTTCFGYTRVSTVKQGEGVSLEAQRDEIIRYADKHGLTISRWFEEKETAAKSGRPIFNAIVRDLLNHKAEGLIVHKIDRSARNFRDWAQIGELADKGVSIHFATESLDFQSRGGRLTADIQAVIASDYIRNLREEAIKGLKGRLKQGFYPYMAPLGYLNQGGGKLKTLDPARAPLIRAAFELYNTGTYSIRTLHKKMHALGLRNRAGNPLSRHGIETILANPFYCGVIRIKRSGETYAGKHEPIISTSLFASVQDLKTGKFGKKLTRHQHLYRGLFKCGSCGFAMIAERQKGNVYYRCHTRDCPTKGVREETITEEICVELAHAQLSAEQYKWFSKALLNWQGKQPTQSDLNRSFRLQSGKIAARLESLTDALLDGLVDKDIYLKKRKELLLVQESISQNRNQTNTFGDNLRYLRKFLELAKSFVALYEQLNPSEKRLMLELATSNRTIAGKSITLKPSIWFETMQSGLPAPNGAHCQPINRTGTETLERQLDRLYELIISPK
ncbi:recombinase family protein [Pseudohalocynthiibacter sp. F2068]|jgi:site-specific DNA recombinase|uniref:recombinase family protein n=1 Tax=Pseudohalocynthiibacter sp. F2068 TaxID=2926418 RepID=UPI001FF212B6|nr:recombinase family protein [Pseudohalocynthiibacter sp. F2068]MCK0104265.1 recombinase family protein [Pseudohalocynthiibacter sp. F2068]